MTRILVEPQQPQNCKNSSERQYDDDDDDDVNNHDEWIKQKQVQASCE